MAMDLRDQFALRLAPALVDALGDPISIARRAYDLAEAMLAERARRIDLDEAQAAREAEEDEEPVHPALLDEPMPMMESEEAEIDPRWLEPPYDPSWDISDARGAPPSDRPGLARTRPEDVAKERKERSA